MTSATKRSPRSTTLALLSALALALALLPPSFASAVETSTDVWINEFHYDDVGADEGEFIEVAATEGTDLTGWSLVLYNGNGGETYGSVTDLGASEATGATGGVEFVTAPIPGLQNGAPDGFALVDADGAVVQLLAYEGVFDAVGGPADGLTSTDVGVSESGSTPAGESLQLTGPGSAYADFTWADPAPETPGAANDGQSFGDAPPPPPPPPPGCDSDDITRISTIQGDGEASTFTGDPVFTPGPELTIRAIVTLAEPDLDGFFVQEAQANEDGDPATSEGLFIEATIPAGIEPGDTVAIAGGVKENFDRTELEATAVDICDVPPTTIEPVALPLPSSVSEREPFENMLVTAGDLVVSGSFSAYQFGELITGYDGVLPQATEIAEPGDAAEEAAEQIKARELILDDRSTEAFVNTRSVWDQDPERRLGDRIREVTGVLDYSFGNYKLQYTEFPEFELFGAPDVPRLTEGNDLAAFNVLNFFDEFGSSSRLRGARDQEQFDLQSAKIVDTILELDATVLGLIELQNDYLDEYDSDPDTQPSIATLVDLLNLSAGDDDRYDYVRIPEEQLATEGLNGGGAGTDAIANGIIYQPARVTQVGEAAIVNLDEGLAEYPLDDDDEVLLDEEPRPATKTRWPVAASFELDGQLLTVAVNHFKSKGSVCDGVFDTAEEPAFGVLEDVESPFTANCDLTRRYAAKGLVDWVATDPTDAGTDNVFLVGDLNSYAEEAPIRILEDAGYLNTVEEHADGAFTYKFSGRVGTLDYLMASGAAAGIVDDAAVWQTNSRASYVDLYYIADDTTRASGNLPKGASDHDPLVLSLLAADDDPDPTAPTDKDDCRDDGWRSFTDPSFRNQGQCVAFVASGELHGAARARGGPGAGGR